MISTKDLMIGNWVYMEAHRGYEAQYIQVETIPDSSSKDHYGHIGAFPVGGDNDFRDIEDRHLFPIPLTAEILEKNFQEFLPGINLMYKLKGPYCAVNEDGQWVFGLVKVDGENSTRYPLVKISYVHQLQNALRLCGIEHEIIL